MGTYAITCARSGMGRAVVERLVAAGHTVITVDLADAPENLAAPQRAEQSQPLLFGEIRSGGGHCSSALQK